MNDEYREATSESEWSSRDAGTGTATAEPVDRRWFEEALRAQGFLVEPPVAGDDPMWQDTADSDSPAGAGAMNEAAAAIKAETPETDDLAIAEAEAVIEADAPFTADVELRPETADLDMGAIQLVPEPWDLPAQAPAVLTWDADAAHTPESAAAPSWAVEPAADPGTSWSRVGTTPVLLTTTPGVVSAGQPVVSTARQAVQPATLPPNVPPVPTAALAARLARTGPSGTTAAPAPVAPEAMVQAAWVDHAAPTVASTSAASPTLTADVWTLPALKADLAAERVSEAAPTLDLRSQPVTATASVAAELAVAEPAVGELAVAELAVAELAVAEPAVGELAVAELAVAEPAVAELAVAEPAVTAPTDATTAPVQPSAPFSPPTGGIADVARRPAGPALRTPVDGGDSDLWGLVGDPTKSSAAVGAAPKARKFSATSILLNIFVAIVVVALVIGFGVLLTSLL